MADAFAKIAASAVLAAVVVVKLEAATLNQHPVGAHRAAAKTVRPPAWHRLAKLLMQSPNHLHLDRDVRVRVKSVTDPNKRRFNKAGHRPALFLSGRPFELTTGQNMKMKMVNRLPAVGSAICHDAKSFR